MMPLRDCLRVLRRLFRPVRGRVFVSILIGLVRIAASLAFVWISKSLVDIATGVSDAPLGTHVALLAGILALQIATNVASSWWENVNVVKTQTQLRADFFARVMHSRWNGREAFHSGDTVNRLEEDIRIVVDLLCTRFPDVIVTLCQLLAASWYLLTLAPKLAWLLLLLMAVAVVGSRLCFKVVRRLTADIRTADSGIQQHMQENLLNRIVVLTLGATQKVLAALGYRQDALVSLSVRRQNYSAVGRAFMGLGFLSGYAAAFLWGVYGIRGGTVTFGMMTAFLQLVGQVQRPIAELARHVPAFIHALTSVERLEELAALPQEEAGAPVVFPGAPEIVVDHVTFAYPDAERPVFRDFSRTFGAGTLTAVMGATGEGKTTLIRLLMALLQPSEGRILIGGVPSSPATRANFMYVPQGNTLLSGTIRENLRLADPAADEERMKEALRLAAAEFVLDLPEGLDTVCSEKGAGLSEGQAQRIAIARALLREGGVLILDESTSALDGPTEARLLQNIAAAYKGRKTLIIISHRESVLPLADAVLKL
ncbi:MAG: ABC transporter ATP-binding protein/permease [Bacteroidales bacterium]|nr:ABC transporter ATP-binding protein/permease [Bacteroidales bacterium]